MQISADTLRKFGIVAGSAVAIALGIIVPSEGLIHVVYRDVGGVQTYCFGETGHPVPGHYYTTTECEELVIKRAQQFQRELRACVRRSMPVKVEAAMIDAAYNLGTPTVCNGTMGAYLKLGHWREACDRLPLYVHAAGRVWKGLVIRRGKEQAVCLEGAYE